MQVDLSSLLQHSGLKIQQDISSLALKAGQEFLAKVVNILGDNKVTLEMAGKLIEAQTTQQLTKGQTLKLVVEQEGGNTLLRIAEGKKPESPIQTYLRRVVPHQTPIKPLLESLSQLKLSNEQLKPLPQSLRQDLQQLQQIATQLQKQMPPAQNLSKPETLKQVILNSGQFFESRLAHTPQSYPPNDMKGLLLRLYALLIRITAPPADKGIMQLLSEPTARSVTELLAQHANKQSDKALLKLDRELLASLLTMLKQTKGSIARLQSQQLSTLTRQESNELVWLFELPVRNEKEEHMVRIRIQREAEKNGNETEYGWTVNLVIHDDMDKPIRIAVELKGQSVTCNFFSHRKETSEAFNQQLPKLNQRLVELGFEVASAQSHHTTIKDEEDALVHDYSGLLNVTV